MFNGAVEVMFHAAPTIIPSAASPAFLIRPGELRPLPPMMRTVLGIPSWRAWLAIPDASSAKAAAMMASGFWALIWVSCGEKSRSPLAKICSPSIWMPAELEFFFEYLIGGLRHRVVVSVKHRDLL